MLRLKIIRELVSFELDQMSGGYGSASTDARVVTMVAKQSGAVERKSGEGQKDFLTVTLAPKATC